MKHADGSDDMAQIDLLYRRVSLRLLPFALICFVAASIDRTNVSFAKFTMMTSLGMSDAAYGFGAGIFFLGYFLFEVPSNLMLDRVGPRRWIARIMISWGIVSAATAFVSTPGQFYVVRFLLGVAEAGFFPGLILYIARWYPLQRRGAAMAWFMIALPLATIIGGPLSGLILKGFDGVLSFAGWRWLFVLEALPSILLGFLSLRFLHDRIADAKWLSAKEIVQLESNVRGHDRPTAEKASLSVMKDRRLWAFAAIYFVIGSTNYALVFWMPTVIRDLGVLDPVRIGFLAAIPALISIVTTVAIGRASDHVRDRRFIFAACALLGAAGLAGSALSKGDLSWQIGLLSAATIGGSALPPLFWTLTTSQLRERDAAAGIAAINSVANLSGFFGPSMIGILHGVTGNIGAGLTVIAMLLIGAIALLFRAVRTGTPLLSGSNG